MKKLFLIASIGFILASCGDGAGNSSGSDSTSTSTDTSMNMSADTSMTRTDTLMSTPPVTDTSNPLSVDSLKKGSKGDKKKDTAK